MESKKQWPLTISEDLLKTWQRLRRKKDSTFLSEKLGVSKPVIERALLYGYVSLPELPAQITAYFEERLKAERKDAKRLDTLAAEVEQK